MGCNPNWSYITHALMLMLQINHWRLVQTGLTGHSDVAFAFVFALIILYKWTLGCMFTDSDSDNQWSRFHRIDIHFTLLGVGLGLCESGLDQNQLVNSPIECWPLIVQLLTLVAALFYHIHHGYFSSLFHRSHSNWSMEFFSNIGVSVYS